MVDGGVRREGIEDTVAVGCVVTRMAVAGFGSSETEGDLLPSEPRWALHMCDNKCRAKGFKFFEMAVIVTEEGSAAHTINLCKTCDNAGRLKQGEK